MANRFLPVRELPLVGESLTGFVRRHVLAMGYQNLRQLLNLAQDARFPAHLDQLKPGAALVALGRILDRDADTFSPMTAHRWAKQLMLCERGMSPPAECDAKTLHRFFAAARPRVCPRCLQQSPLLDRLIWSFLPLGVCTEHAEVLIERCPNCRRRFSPSRLDLVRCRCGYCISYIPPVAVTGRALDLTHRLYGWHAGKETWAAELPASAGFWWLDRLRSATTRAPTWLETLKQQWNVPRQLSDVSLSWLAAADLLDAWPRRFVEFLDVYQTIGKHLATTTGVGRAFGHLLRDADRLERFGYSRPADTLREYLVTRYHRGHVSSKVTLFRTPSQSSKLERRSWISQTAAAKRLGVSAPTIADLVQRGVLTGNITPAGGRGRTVGVVDGHAVQELQRRMLESLSVAQAANQLGVERHRVLDLINGGVLRDAIRSKGGWRLSQATVKELLNMIDRFPPLTVSGSGWISLREATRRFGVSDLNLLRVIQLVCAGQLRARRDPSNRSLRGLWLNSDELRIAAEAARSAAESQVGYSLHRLASLLVPGKPLKHIVLQKWIRSGLLQARRLRKGWQVPPEEVTRFRETYCLAPEACALIHATRSTLSRWEATGRIRPIYGRRTHPGAGASVFLRDEILRLAA
jgi:plasmid maintenance system antidote protein VapI